MTWLVADGEDSIRFECTVSGTGPINVGVATSTFTTPPVTMDGETRGYRLFDPNGVQFENGEGVYDDGAGTITRTDGGVTTGSAGAGARVDFTASDLICEIVPLAKHYAEANTRVQPAASFGLGADATVQRAVVAGQGIVASGTDVSAWGNAYGLGGEWTAYATPQLQPNGSVRTVANGATSTSFAIADGGVIAPTDRVLLMFDVDLDVASDMSATVFVAGIIGSLSGLYMTSQVIYDVPSYAAPVTLTHEFEQERQQIAMLFDRATSEAWVVRKGEITKYLEWKQSIPAVADWTSDNMSITLGNNPAVADRTGSHDWHGCKSVSNIPAISTDAEVFSMLRAELAALGRDVGALTRQTTYGLGNSAGVQAGDGVTIAADWTTTPGYSATPGGGSTPAIVWSPSVHGDTVLFNFDTAAAIADNVHIILPTEGMKGGRSRVKVVVRNSNTLTGAAPKLWFQDPGTYSVGVVPAFNGADDANWDGPATLRVPGLQARLAHDDAGANAWWDHVEGPELLAPTADEVSVAASPTNYSAASADVEAHLAGVDNALGVLSPEAAAAGAFDPTDIEINAVAKIHDTYTQSGAVSFTLDNAASSINGGTVQVPFSSDGSALSWDADLVMGVTGANGDLPALLPSGVHLILFQYDETLDVALVFFGRSSAAEVTSGHTPANFSNGGSGATVLGNVEGIDIALGALTTEVSEDTSPVLGSDLDGAGYEIGGYLNPPVSASGSLTVAAHNGKTILTTGAIVIPTTAGFWCNLIGGGPHNVTFNGTSNALAAGDLRSLVVQSATVIRSVTTLAADQDSYV